MMNNESKIFVSIQPSDEGGLEWLEYDVGMLIEKAANYDEREKIRRWMENCKPGGFLMLNNNSEVVMCHGEQTEFTLGQEPDYFADEGHRTTSESKVAFLRHRKDIGPVDRVEVRWDEGPIDCNTLVIGKNGNQMGLSGFAVGYEGESFVGMTWLLDMCGMDYDKVELSKINTYTQKEVVFNPADQIASILNVVHLDQEIPMWRANIDVHQPNGRDYTLHYPDENSPIGHHDINVLVDIIMFETEMRGVQWSGLSRVAVGYTPNEDVPNQENTMQSIEKILSENLGWNYASPLSTG